MAGRRRKEIRVVFFGNHDVGIAALGSLLPKTNVVAVIAHPPDPEEGVCFSSLHDFAFANEIPVIRGRGTEDIVYEFVKEASPDLIWVTDYRYLLPIEITSLAKIGTVNLHPSLLPKYRGRAPLNWAIINGEDKIGLTAHFIDEGVDSGDIIKQLPLSLSIHQDVGDAINLLIPIYRTITEDVINCFIEGNVPRCKQDVSQYPVFPSRKPEDGQIHWKNTALDICNLIRAVSHPYPGAFTYVNGRKLYLWKSYFSEDISRKKQRAGTVLKLNNSDGFDVQCGDGVLNILKWSAESDEELLLTVGDILT
jgi:methionyl-tRNA formyltransferase